MAQPLSRFPLFLLLLCAFGRGRSVEVILGDSFAFPHTENCSAAKGELILRTAPDTARLVAAHTHGAWEAGDRYRGRVRPGSSVSVSRAVFTDGGTYELICDVTRQDEFAPIQVKVLVPYYASVAEGDAGRLHCYCDKPAESVMWTKDGRVVFRRNLSSGADTYGTGHRGKVSMSREAAGEGDMSLQLLRARTDDAGDYRCFVNTNEFLAAVRLTVKEASCGTNATTQPPTDTCEALGAIFGIITAPLFVAVLFYLLGWCLKSGGSDASGDRRAGEESVRLGPPRPPQCSGRYPEIISIRTQQDKDTGIGSFMENQHWWH